MKAISLFQKSQEASLEVFDDKVENVSKIKSLHSRGSVTLAVEDHLPTFPDSVFDALPAFLQKVVARCDSNEDRDMMLIGSVVTLGSCMPKVYGFYGEKRVFPNLYLFITAQASAGKGRLVLCRQLVNLVHDALREQTRLAKQQYETGMRQYNILKWKTVGIEKPVKPPELMLFIPANNSATGVFQLLSDNDGHGLLFETEGDTLANALKSDYGDYSDGLRKGFHHEMICYYRRTDHEYVQIKCPCISGVFSSTPHQVLSLIPNAENGLLSRFIFYHMNIQPEWKDMFAASNNGMEDYFDALGKEFFSFYQALNNHPAIEVCHTPWQHEQLKAFFIQLQEKYKALQGLDFMATIRRMGLIAFRFAMILTTLRILESGNFSDRQECSDSDFQRVLSMIRVLVKHSSHVFSQLPQDVKPTTHKNKKEQFLDGLPEKFTRQEFIKLAKSIGITDRSAQAYILNFCEKGLIFHEQHDTYINPNALETKDESNGET